MKTFWYSLAYGGIVINVGVLLFNIWQFYGYHNIAALGIIPMNILAIGCAVNGILGLRSL